MMLPFSNDDQPLDLSFTTGLQWTFSSDLGNDIRRRSNSSDSSNKSYSSNASSNTCDLPAVCKARRLKLGLTQSDLGDRLGVLCGQEFSQTTVSRFEARNLSVNNMAKLSPVFEAWLADVNEAAEEVVQEQVKRALKRISKKRKKRTAIDKGLKARLEAAFRANPRPSLFEIEHVSQDLDLDRTVVRVWFCNRRQSEKRQKSGLK